MTLFFSKFHEYFQNFTFAKNILQQNFYCKTSHLQRISCKRIFIAKLHICKEYLATEFSLQNFTFAKNILQQNFHCKTSHLQKFATLKNLHKKNFVTNHKYWDRRGKEQSDQGVQCLQFHLHLSDPLVITALYM